MQKKSQKILEVIYFFTGTFFAVSFILKYVGESATFQGDTYYLLSTGRYIIEHRTIPHINPFTYGFPRKIVIQNWLSCVYDYFIYNKFGEIGLYVSTAVICLTAALLMYLYASKYTKHKWIQVSTFVLGTLCIVGMLNIRAGSVTFIILIIEQMVLYDYFYRDKTKTIWLLPLFSIFMVNHQASYWPFLFIFILPYLVPGPTEICKKSIKEIIKNIKRIWIPFCVSFLCGFINPYGTKNMFYLLYSYGSASKSNIIAELCPPQKGSIGMIMVIVGIILFVCLLIFSCLKMPTSVFYLAIGILILSGMAQKNMWLLPIGMIPVFALLLEKVVQFDKKSFVTSLLIFKIIYVVLLILVFNTYENYEYEKKLDDVCDCPGVPCKGETLLTKYNKPELFTEQYLN